MKAKIFYFHLRVLHRNNAKIWQSSNSQKIKKFFLKTSFINKKQKKNYLQLIFKYLKGQ